MADVSDAEVAGSSCPPSPTATRPQVCRDSAAVGGG